LEQNHIWIVFARQIYNYSGVPIYCPSKAKMAFCHDQPLNRYQINCQDVTREITLNVRTNCDQIEIYYSTVDTASQVCSQTAQRSCHWKSSLVVCHLTRSNIDSSTTMLSHTNTQHQ